MCTPPSSPPRCWTGCPASPTPGGSRADGLLTQQAHHRGRVLVNELLSDSDRRAAARWTLRPAARLGIASVHELGGPHLGPLADLTRVREVGEELGLGVVAYWGELASAEAFARARAVGAAGLAGDLCVDGSIGSRTAALHAAYADAGHRGAQYLDEDEIAEHLAACTRAGMTAGFHCIGDAAVAAAVAGLRRAADEVGVDAVRRARHRLEHLELVAAADIPTLAELDVVASVQPAFDAAWGRPGELYETRLGAGSGADHEPVRFAGPGGGDAGVRHRCAGHPGGRLGHGPGGGPAQSGRGAAVGGRCVRRRHRGRPPGGRPDPRRPDRGGLASRPGRSGRLPAARMGYLG